MDDRHVDALARTLAAPSARRAIERLLVGGALTGLWAALGGAGSRDAAGKPKKKGRKR